MKICIHDLEALQPSNNICEIGAVILDTHKKCIVDGFQTLVNPGEKVTDYKLRHAKGTITDLTGITQSMLDQAPSTELAMFDFWSWFATHQMGGRLVAWGNDGEDLIQQTPRITLDTAIETRINIIDIRQTVWLLAAMMPGKNRRGLKNAMKQFGLDFVGIPHRAYWDAYNTARLLWRIMKMVDLAKYIENFHPDSP